MKRLWHVEHADGSEWTYDDLGLWAMGHPEAQLVYYNMLGFFIGDCGNLVILDDCGNWCYAPESDDMVVVWDE